MTTVTAQESGRYTFPHGVHPPENKSLAEEAAIEVVATPKQVELPVLQHIGAPSKSTLKPRSEVTLGQEVLEAGGFVSAPAHAPIAGKTAKATLCTLPSGRHLECIPIKAAGEQLEGQALYDDVLGGDWPYAETQRLASEEIFARIQGAGIVGLGGAAFPTHVKFAKNEDKPIRTIVVNGCECEPYLTADDRLMREAPAPVIAGALLAARSAGAQEVVIGVEDNKPQAIATLREQAEKAAGTGVPVRVAVLKSKYPQGGERQLIRALLRLEVPTGGLPLDVGVVVINVGTRLGDRARAVPARQAADPPRRVGYGARYRAAQEPPRADRHQLPSADRPLWRAPARCRARRLGRSDDGLQPSAISRRR
jgi:electron transport complex protein RnfC